MSPASLKLVLLHCFLINGLNNLLSDFAMEIFLYGFQGTHSGKWRASIVVGVVGFPNTGKSSLINSLKRSRVCNVGATPGITKSAVVIGFYHFLFSALIALT